MSVEDPKQSTPSGTDVTGPVTDAVLTLIAEYIEALSSLDPARISSFYHDDAAFRLYLDGQALTREALVAGVTQMCSAIEGLEGRWEEAEVTALGSDVALAATRFERILVQSDTERVTDWGTATWVCQVRDGVWRFIHGHAVHYPGALP